MKTKLIKASNIVSDSLLEVSLVVAQTIEKTGCRCSFI